jgi:hypothetical protein
MGPRGVESGTPRRRVSLARELRRAKCPARHACSGPECFVCLVAAYAQTVTLQKPIYGPRRKRA